MRFVIKIIFIAAVAYGLAHVLRGIYIDSFWTAIVFATVLAILNIFVRPLLILFTLPVTILTLGLFLFIINAIVVGLASNLVHGIRIDGFGWTLLFSLLLSLASSILDKELERDKKKVNW